MSNQQYDGLSNFLKEYTRKYGPPIDNINNYKGQRTLRNRKYMNYTGVNNFTPHNQRQYGESSSSVDQFRKNKAPGSVLRCETSGRSSISPVKYEAPIRNETSNNNSIN
ncbi:12588_t:CDS:1, partial [Rhizophagus irregularis]